MNRKQWLVAIVLFDFLVLNAVVVYQYGGYIPVIQAVVSSLAGIVVLVDLTIAISLIAVWMWNDAKARGISTIPYLVVSLFLGSVGPLAYLLRTLGRPQAETTAPRLAAATASR